MSKIYKATRIVCPTFFIAGIDQKVQMLTKVELFTSKSDAQKWLKDHPLRYSIEKARISVLKEKEIKNYRLHSNYLLDISLELPPNLYSDYKPTTQTISLRFWNKVTNLWGYAVIDPEIKEFYSLE